MILIRLYAISGWPNGFEKYDVNGESRCYRFNNNALTWSDAKENCLNVGSWKLKSSQR